MKSTTSARFWDSRDGFPPESITAIDDYGGAENLGLRITQTSLSASAQKKLVAAWCEKLPALDNVRYLWFQSKVTQEMFDAACCMPGLRGLFVKWSAVKTLENLPRLKSLRQIFIGGAPAVTSIEPLSQMSDLEWLETENLKGVSDFSPLRRLQKLTGLGVTGDLWTRQPIDTLTPLSELTGLKWLAVGAVSDGSLRPLAKLTNLKWLFIPNRYPVEEYAWLSVHLPKTECRWFQPYDASFGRGMACTRCGQHSEAMMTGKPAKVLCLSCDREKVAQHVQRFQELQARYS